jgi:glyoxylase-like metal-dependent hydrolase (beta-lactamase superfamily II)
MSGSSSASARRGPWLARLLAPAGPPEPTRRARAGAEVLGVPGRYCVTYLLLGPGGVGVLDVGSQADVPLVLAALESAGRSAADVRWVMPSHMHFDHVMGLDAFARRCRAPILLGRTAYEAVSSGRKLRFAHWTRLLRAIPTWPMQGMPFPPLSDWREGLDFGMPWGRNRFRAPLAPPVDSGALLPGLPGWTLHDGPGHADDAILLHHAAAGFLVVGDTVRNFYGGEWNPLLCDREAYARTVERIRGLRVETVFPAHGPVLDGPDVVARLKAYPFYVP